MFENLSEKLTKAFKIIKGAGKITEINIAESLKEVRKALIQADVSYNIAKEFCDNVKQNALGQNVLTSIEPSQLIVKIVHDELTKLMGSSSSGINIKGSPAVVLIAGLQGSGKTTFSAKLANMLKAKQSKQVLLVACDVYRPAAIEQLKVLGEGINVEVYSEEGNNDPVKIAKNAVKYAKEHNKNVVIVDTAGRLAVDEQMMQEITNLKETLNPQETLFVVDSMTGQDAVNTAKVFFERLNFDGVVLTKLDGDTRGGAALSIRYIINRPIKFISLGEKMEALDIFYPDRMASRILGMGDIISLVEKAQEQYDEAEARKISKRLKTNEFDFDDFLSQLHQIKKMGSIKDLVGMIPGMGNMMKNTEIDENVFKNMEVIISSMTPYEKANPAKIDVSRKKRIAKGSGKNIEDVNRLLKQFEQTRKMMKQVASGKAQKMMRNFKGR
ncbi:MAG: signal recognition particle protein [Bacteroidales bacterium]|jgi:signal recognition particle subunit SRP54|nr:signal recognition particle protein [Bacteroidales bacterium]